MKNTIDLDLKLELEDLIRRQSHEQESTQASLLQKLSSASLNVKNAVELDLKLKYGDLLTMQSQEQESPDASLLQKLSSANINVKMQLI